MKELKDMTAAELVRHLENGNYVLQALKAVGAAGSETNHIIERKFAITAELDARCEKAEISIINRAGMNQFKYGAYIDGTNGVWLGIPAVEQHALEGYLLSKEVKP